MSGSVDQDIITMYTFSAPLGCHATRSQGYEEIGDLVWIQDLPYGDTIWTL